jgi:hypothetical protein
MHTNKAVLLVMLAAALAIRADQETLNAFFATGAGFGMGGRIYTSTAISGGNVDYTDRFFNYGSGMKFDLGCQYFLMDDVALQASFGYSAGIPWFKQELNANANSKITTTYQRHLFGIKALIVSRFEALDLIDVYTGVGPGLFWAARPFTVVAKTTVGTQEANGRITADPAIGFTGLLGTDYPLSDKFTLFGEFAFEAVRFNLNRYIISESDIPAMQTGTEFYSADDSNNRDPDNVPGTNFQIRIGIRYALMTK